jgi:hypothetical protein
MAYYNWQMCDKMPLFLNPILTAVTFCPLLYANTSNETEFDE